MDKQNEEEPFDDGLNGERSYIFQTLHRNRNIEFPTEMDKKDHKMSEFFLLEAKLILAEDREMTHDDEKHILETFNRAIAYAPTDSAILNSLYQNKANFLYECQRYEEFLTELREKIRFGVLKPALRAKFKEKKLHCEEVIRAEAKLVNIKDPAMESEQEIMDNQRVMRPFASGAIRVDFDRKQWGRHIKAARDIEPGEIIVLEPSSLSFANPENNYLRCSHCLRLCWNALPCNDCTRCIYCSKNCRRRALDEYHSFECKVLSSFTSVNLQQCMGLTYLKAMLVYVKRLEGIKNLEKDIIRAYAAGDTLRGQFTLKNIYDRKGIGDLYCRKTAEITSFDSEELTNEILFACRATYYLATRTNFFGVQFPIGIPIMHILRNDEILFVASLLVRSVLVFPYNCFPIASYKFYINEKCFHEKNDHIGTAVYPFGSLFNHSCNPNAQYFISRKNELVVFAKFRIKKNSQVFIAYFGKDFIAAPKEDRQSYLLLRHIMKCSCDACTNDWTYEDLLSFEDSLKKKMTLMQYEDLTDKMLEAQNDWNAETLYDNLKDCLHLLKVLVKNKVPERSQPYDDLTHFIYILYVKLFGYKPQFTCEHVHKGC